MFMARFLFLGEVSWRVFFASFLVCGRSAAAHKIACYAPITMDKTAPKIKYASRQNQIPVCETDAGRN
jgi:hypothetical protein